MTCFISIVFIIILFGILLYSVVNYFLRKKAWPVIVIMLYLSTLSVLQRKAINTMYSQGYLVNKKSGIYKAIGLGYEGSYIYEKIKVYELPMLSVEYFIMGEKKYFYKIKVIKHQGNSIR